MQVPPVLLQDTPLIAPAANDPTTITAARRPANYQPSIWNHDFVKSLKSDFAGEVYTKRAEKLKEYVRRMFDDKANNGLSSSSTSLLKLINTIQRLGVSYHFDDEIKGALDTITLTIKDNDVSIEGDDKDLFTTALRFRLLRQHGYEISQDVFKSFQEEMRSSSDDFMKPCICEDVEGMLSLYEASFYAFEGEEILDEAQEFTGRHLKEYLKNKEGINSTSTPKHLCNHKQLVSHALDLPLHLRVPRIEARWFIDTYEQMMQEDMDPLLLEFAKLDFNMIQATYHEELKYVSRWWKELGFTETLCYARDRWVENFFWSVGYKFEAKYGHYRIQMTKLNCLITTIDDIYDVYGSLDELKLFTDAVDRWDDSMVGALPDYMKIGFLALYNTTNEIACDILKKHGQDVLGYLRTSWAALCKSYLVEAKWYYSGYKPTLEEFLNNGWISITGSVLPTHTYVLLGYETIDDEALECLKNYSSDLVRWSFMILRLLNDLATSTEELKRGDVTKSIQCYMHHTGVSESIAREHIKNQISDMWKKINKDQSASRSIFPRSFVETILNINRITHFFYHYGDGHGVPNRETKDWVTSIVIEPIPLLI
ncbi:Terpene synthase [Macleaya cordata]|uniref:Terpene synthase n=1 Tax=Macleaya cordata TaxID=56857 RepID=A0A200R069_MACCD|nr:Terpene synthase [Macleaya cordata]